MYKIEQATEEDLIMYVTLARHMHDESVYAQFLDFNDAKVEGAAQNMIFSPNYHVIKACDDEMQVGFFAGGISAYYVSYDKYAFDVATYVAPQYRGKGIAKALITDFVGWAKKHGARELCLSTSTGVNDEHFAALTKTFNMKQQATTYKVRL
jgi:GNAT superfamily N-acetyltransferase|tara:strand:- start:3459 stop:3914 length:456 start_codon:yes stop_codon:yes gene_type:complete